MFPFDRLQSFFNCFDRPDRTADDPGDRDRLDRPGMFPFDNPDRLSKFGAIKTIRATIKWKPGLRGNTKPTRLKIKGIVFLERTETNAALIS